MDVAWSPAHPAMFTSADASGRLDLWNLNTDIEVLYGQGYQISLYL